MAKRGGFPGGMGMPGNMNNLMKQAQRMQRQMEEKTKELEEKQYTAAAGGGAVTVTVSGDRLSVCNSGAGGPLDAGRIFDRFYQGTKNEVSTGLGLAVVDVVCRLYGLKVSYSYKEGRHCFAVDFPA